MGSKSTTSRHILSVRGRAERARGQSLVRREARLRPRTGMMPLCSLVRGRPNDFDDDEPTRERRIAIRPPARLGDRVMTRATTLAVFVLLAIAGAVVALAERVHPGCFAGRPRLGVDA